MTDDATASEKSKPTKAGNGLMPDFSPWMGGGANALDSWAQPTSSMMKGSFELAQEMLAFSQMRLQANIDAWKALTACRNPGDLLECQKEFTDKATAQCVDEANKISSRVISIMSGAAVPFREQATKS
jgi:hypothetical protein